jgi:hypothetical protein
MFIEDKREPWFPKNMKIKDECWWSMPFMMIISMENGVFPPDGKTWSSMIPELKVTALKQMASSQNLERSQILFVDDLLDNVQAARDEGFMTWHLSSFEKLLKLEKELRGIWNSVSDRPKSPSLCDLDIPAELIIHLEMASSVKIIRTKEAQDWIDAIDEGNERRVKSLISKGPM